MNLKQFPELHAFLATYFTDADPDTDEQVTRAFVQATSPEKLYQVVSQAKLLHGDAEFPVEELGTEANRWFGDSEEARIWLGKILGILQEVQSLGVVVIKDSNGTVLQEGDSVQVVKDLKVKGGSSDLKRGTLIKKIHLIGDPDLIECRVDGSTLVLKTCFLKKA